MNIRHLLLLVLAIPAACGMDRTVPSSGGEGRRMVSSRWLSDARSMPDGIIRVAMSEDGSYRMEMVHTKGSLSTAKVATSTGSVVWGADGLMKGSAGRTAGEMRHLSRWTASFEDHASIMVLAPHEGAPIVFEREDI